MKNEVYFENVEKIGDLFIDYIFTEYENEAIVFVCKDIDENLYLCVCTEIRYIQKWMLAEIHIETLRNLIYQRMDLLSVFINNDMLIEITMDAQGKECSRWIASSALDELDLPKKGVYLLCDKVSAYNYLWNQYAKDGMIYECRDGKIFVYGNVKLINQESGLPKVSYVKTIHSKKHNNTIDKKRYSMKTQQYSLGEFLKNYLCSKDNSYVTAYNHNKTDVKKAILRTANLG